MENIERIDYENKIKNTYEKKVITSDNIINTSFFKNKKALLTELSKYKSNLPPEIIDYLHYLIELQFSVIKPIISEKEENKIKNLDIYKKITVYNIYNRAKQILQNNSKYVNLNNSNHKLIGMISEKKENYNVFAYDFSNVFLKNNKLISDMEQINLYTTIYDKELKEKELLKIQERYNKELESKKPYPDNSIYFNTDYYFFEEYNTEWEINHYAKLEFLRKKQRELESKNELTNDNKNAIKIQNYLFEIFLSDYGLTLNEFKKVNNIFLEDKENESDKEKKLVKLNSNISIYTHIKKF